MKYVLRMARLAAALPRTATQFRVCDDTGGVANSTVGRPRHPRSMSVIDRAEVRRKSALATMDPSDQAALGQYFTRYQAALIIAAMPRLPQSATIRVLDPGAGSGMLAAALVDRLHAERLNVEIRSLWLGFPADDRLRDAAAHVQKHLPFRLSAKHWRRWRATKDGQPYRATKITSPLMS